jgi:subtilase family serine protease
VLLSVAHPSALLLSPGALVPASSAGLPAGLSPAQVRQAYGFNQITFANGTVQGNGSGQTIAIVDAYDQPNLASNLATFDSTYGIAAPPSFTKVNETGGSTLPAASASWGLEESLDVEWAHAIAPGAKIVLVEASSSSLTDLLTAVNYARNLAGVSVVSMSWGASDFNGESSYDSYFTTPSGHAGVTFVASSGDSGSSGAPEFPSVSANVLAVGGTQLSVDSSGNYLSESGWSGSGGGVSQHELQPAFQKGVVSQSSKYRTVPDVSYDGSSGSPFAVYDTDSYSGWLEVYGTSAGAPQWAALVAIADQGRALAGQGSLDGATQALPALYKLPAADFHDVTSGSNGGYSAGAGYDLVTGRGSPVANLVVAGLVGNSSTSPTPTPTPPQVVTPAHASANPVTGTTTNLSVLGNDAAGAASLAYTWSLVSGPAGIASPTFSANGTNAAQNTTATFYAAGSYVFRVMLKDAAGLTATSSVTVTVNQTQMYLTLSPGSVSLADGHAQQFTVKALDQFGIALAKQPAWTWSLTSGAGAISASGLYTAPPSGSGSAVVRVSGGGESVSASVKYVSTALTIPINVTARAVSSGWALVTWQETSTNQTGFIVERSSNGGPWTVAGAVTGNATFFDDTTAWKRGTSSYRVAAYNASGQSAYSAATAGVRPSASPVGPTLVAGLKAASTSDHGAGRASAAVQQSGSTFQSSPQQVTESRGTGPVGSPATSWTRESLAVSDAFWAWLANDGTELRHQAD